MPTYSHFRLSTVEDCPLKYKCTYVDRLERERRDSIEAFMGMCHQGYGVLDEALDY